MTLPGGSLKIASFGAPPVVKGPAVEGVLLEAGSFTLVHSDTGLRDHVAARDGLGVEGSLPCSTGTGSTISVLVWSTNIHFDYQVPDHIFYWSSKQALKPIAKFTVWGWNLYLISTYTWTHHSSFAHKSHNLYVWQPLWYTCWLFAGSISRWVCRSQRTHSESQFRLRRLSCNLLVWWWVESWYHCLLYTACVSPVTIHTALGKWLSNRSKHHITNTMIQ